MSKWFVASILSRTALTVDADDADAALQMAKDTVGKMAFSDALKGQSSDYVEVRTKTVDGVSSTDFPTAVDTLVLEITG